MPLSTGKSSATIKKNTRELITTKPSPSRAKAIRTYAERRGITYQEALVKLSSKIAHVQAHRS